MPKIKERHEVAEHEFRGGHGVLKPIETNHDVASALKAAAVFGGANIEGCTALGSMPARGDRLAVPVAVGSLQLPVALARLKATGKANGNRRRDRNWPRECRCSTGAASRTTSWKKRSITSSSRWAPRSLAETGSRSAALAVSACVTGRRGRAAAAGMQPHNWRVGGRVFNQRPNRHIGFSSSRMAPAPLLRVLVGQWNLCRSIATEARFSAGGAAGNRDVSVDYPRSARSGALVGFVPVSAGSGRRQIRSGSG